MNDNRSDPDVFVPDSVVWKELGITRQSLWRRTLKRENRFPPPIKIEGKNYRSRRALEAWKAEQVRLAEERQRQMWEQADTAA